MDNNCERRFQCDVVPWVVFLCFSRGDEDEGNEKRDQRVGQRQQSGELGASCGFANRSFLNSQLASVMAAERCNSHIVVHSDDVMNLF